MIKRLCLLCLLPILLGCSVKNVDSSSVNSSFSDNSSIVSEQVSNIYRSVSWSVILENGSLFIYWTNKDNTETFEKIYKSGNYQIVYRKFDSWKDYQNYLYDYGDTCLLILTIKDVVIY